MDPFDEWWNEINDPDGDDLDIDANELDLPDYNMSDE